MSNKSNNNGRAYEYACVLALESILQSLNLPYKIIENRSIETNKTTFLNADKDTQARFIQSARAGLKTIKELEPMLASKNSDQIIIKAVKDSKGELGDVRDIILNRLDADWEIGLSIKHNHSAVKHSRLSPTIDFGKEWYGRPCSDKYWSDIKPIFDRLSTLRVKKVRWDAVDDKYGSVYVPLLKAFKDEIQRNIDIDDSFVKDMVKYLIGVKDYHKIESQDKKKITLVYCFNLQGTLGRPDGNNKPIKEIPKVSLPEHILDISFKKNTKTTIIITFDEGWSLSFRLHSADSIVETSLKFDVQYVGLPVGVLQFKTAWD